MRRPLICALALVGLAAALVAIVFWREKERGDAPSPVPSSGTNAESGSRGRFVGSVSCRECHERFYELWSPSHHGLAMQPYTPGLARSALTVQPEPMRIGPNSYRMDTAGDKGMLVETGPEGESRYEIVHVLGGKNVYYFLTPLEKGRLQTLPLAYDVRRREWFDTAGSGVRHFPGGEPDRPVHWTDPAYTFNTSCYDCHVSQLSTNYDLETDAYHTEWAEPGINCETCHGPAEEHVRVFQQARATGVEPDGPAIIRTGPFSAEQMNSLCGSCHAKMNPITTSFTPGERFFDHYDLVTLENSDYHPDGRDLGENYTMTGWRMSPCVKGAELSCMHCHTSSGRYRFKDTENPNGACLPCHQRRVERATDHTRHPAGSAGNRCIACHMPMTEFARMTRSDHSMRPPTPAATLRFESPNACTGCHVEEGAAWADEQVRAWHGEDSQEARLRPAELLDAARRGKWDELDAMLASIVAVGRDEIFTASLIRALWTCDAEAKWPVLVRALDKDPSPLVRAASAQGLAGHLTPESLSALLRATADEYRLVRVRAAAALASVPPEAVAAEHRESLSRAMTELVASLTTRPDDFASHFNLGNLHQQRRDHEEAVEAYRTAIRLRPDFVPPYVNLALVENDRGDRAAGESSLRKALALEPENVAARLNLGMLLAEQERLPEAERAFRAALEADPKSAVAAYNLAVLVSGDRPEEGLDWAGKAHAWRPGEPRYACAHAFYLDRSGETERALAILRGLVDGRVPHADAYAMLGGLYEREGRREDARVVYARAAGHEGLSEAQRRGFAARVRAMGGR